MRILILNFDYNAFLEWLYRTHPGLDGAAYDAQMSARNESLFGVADFYSHNLRRLGHEAWELHVNNEHMQRAWAREHGVHLPAASARRLSFRMRRGVVPWIARTRDTRWMYRILEAQIRHYRPDLVLNQIIDEINAGFLRSMRPHFGMLVGQFASPLASEDGLEAYDLLISSLPNFVDRFRASGIPSELNRMGFDERVLDAVPQAERTVDLSFVGSISRHHTSRIALLEYLHERFPLALWGKGIETLPEASPLRSVHHGPAWGREMYAILGRSRITLNHHIGVAGAYANNMRLYESTGMGALLVTDWKTNLHEIFREGEEVIAYRDKEECAEMIRHYLDREDERSAIAARGQARTLREHTYLRRMEELMEIFARYRRA